MFPNQEQQGNQRRSAPSRRRRRACRRAEGYIPYIETFEDRLLLTTYLVNDPGDAPEWMPDPGYCTVVPPGLPPDCTLRAAVTEVDLHGTASNEIDIGVPFVGSAGPQLTLTKTTKVLPMMGMPSVTVMGTGLGFAPGSDGSEVTGLTIAKAPPGMKGSTPGIALASGSNFIHGNDIFGNSGDGITITGGAATGNKVQGNIIGLDPSGKAMGNGLNGVSMVAGASGNLVGIGPGGVAADANVISGNHVDGVRISGFLGPADSNVVAGNYIGTDKTGTMPLGNGLNGVDINGVARLNQIGTKAPPLFKALESNVISGNTGNGVLVNATMVDPGKGNTVLGNYIGTTKAGTSPLGNGGNGVVIADSPNNIVGAKVPGPDNVIAANRMDGILITGAAATGNKVQGNYIGTDKTGAAALKNAFYGVEINAAPSNVIGVGPGLDNLISANGKDGVYITGGAAGNKLAGDYIGTDWTGTLALGNGGNGVQIDGASYNYIGVGSAASGPDNVISGNMKDGVLITGAASGNQLVADYIGSDKAGSAALGNAWNGVEVVGASDTAIGGPDDSGLEPTVPFKNIISANGKMGGAAKGFGVLFQAAAGGFVRNSALGTDKTGKKSLPNANGGVAVIYGSTKVRVGSAVAGNGNLISGNGGPGVLITNSDLMGHNADTMNNTVLGNSIGTNIDGTADLGNSGRGVVVEDGASANTIGGSLGTPSSNLITGNDDGGVLFTGAGTDNLVQGDYIGPVQPGTPPVACTPGDGIDLVDTSRTTLKSLVVSGMCEDGILILGLDSVSNKVQNSKIGTDKTGHTTVPNGKNGVEILLGSGNLIGGSKSKLNIISGNRGFGIRIAGVGARANTVHNNYIGTDASGFAPLPNIDNGVEIAGGATQNFIGGALGVDGNVIAGNTNVGVRITDPGTSGNVVQGNYIGTDKTGKKALGNTSNGVQITFGATRNLIGGATVVRNTRRGGSKTFLLGNIIAGNGGDGVRINEPGTAGNMVQGNKIGTDKTGTVAIANKFYGVEIFNKASGNIIGGMGKTANVIAGNTLDGVYIANAGTMGNVVQGNFIGTDKTGKMALGNGGHGVELALGTAYNTIGGTMAGLGNVIAANAKDGVLLAGDDLVLSTYDLVQGNFIGTDKSGTTAVDPTGKLLGNGGYGVEIAAVSANTIGGTVAGAANVISGNGVTMSAATARAGVRIAGDAKVAATGNLVQGNFIGTNKAGTTTVDTAGNPLGNGTDGIDVVAGAMANTIGGTVMGAGNTIAGNGTALFTGNTMDGVLLSGTGTKANVVQGNKIGTDKTGSTAFDPGGFPLGNGGNGVVILSGASANTIGGTVMGAGNTISGNGGAGVLLVGTAGNLVQGNPIGTDTTGTMTIDASGNSLGNGGDGVDIVGGATANTIGGTTVAAANIVGGNSGAGLLLSGAGTTSNVVQGNFIGTDSSGTLALGNGGDGIDLFSGAAGNTIGGTVAGAGNAIANNVGVGVVVGSSPSDAMTTGNGILGNSIFANALGIDLGADGVTPNHALNPDVGPNHWQNYPLLSSVVSSGGTTTFTGTLDSAASTTFRIELLDNITADPSGNGQGQTYLGFATVMTDSMGHVVLSMMLPVAVPMGDCVAATATDPGNNTSEFSLCVTVTAGTAPSSGADSRLSGLRIEDLALPPQPMSAFGLSSLRPFDSLKANSVEAYPRTLDFFFQAIGQNVPADRGQRTANRGQQTEAGTGDRDRDLLFDLGLDWFESL